MNTLTKVAHVTQVSDTLIIQLIISKYIDDINEKVVPNLSIDDETSVLGIKMAFSNVIYHKGEQSDCGHIACTQ